VADADGTVSALKVRELISGSLRIGASWAAATEYVAGSNDTIDASHIAWWTPAANANGTGANALEAFSVVALDNGGAVSLEPRTVKVDVAGDQADAAQITAVTLPANGTYSTGQTLDFSVVFDRAVNVDTTNGTPSLPIGLDQGSGAAASFLSGNGTKILVFRYTVRSGDKDPNGITVGSVISPNGGAISSVDDGLAVASKLTLPGLASTDGLLVDGINDAPSISGSAVNINYTEGDGSVIANSQLALSDSDSSQLSGATVTISAGLTAGDSLSLSSAVGGITSAYDATTGVLSLSGDASIGDYQKALGRELLLQQRQPHGQ
jgi:hypothetical protein